MQKLSAVCMLYWGKVTGILIGLLSGRPWLLLLGLVLGHQFDRGMAQWRMRAQAGDGARLNRLPESFTQPLFQAMGHLAKCDGKVTPEEIRAARALMHRLGLTSVQVRHAIDWFQSGKEESFPLLSILRQWRQGAGQSHDARQLFVRLLMEVSLSKGSLQHGERAMLWRIASEFDIGRVELAQLEAMLRAQRGFRDSPQGTADAQRVAAAYVTLGLKKSASNDEIKQAYRRLMNRNHPDKLSGSDADAVDVAAAQRRTRNIRSAYEMLKARREIR